MEQYWQISRKPSVHTGGSTAVMKGLILNNQQSLQRETITMMNEMSKRHKNEQFIHDIQIFNKKNIGFDEWIIQIEKVSNLTSKPEYILTLAKSVSTPYKMISQTPSNTAWSELKI